MPKRMRKMVGALLVGAVLLAGLPAVCAAEDEGPVPLGLSSDSSSDGAVITVVVFGVIIAVLFAVSLKSDLDNVFGQADEKREPSDAELSLVIKNLDACAPVAMESRSSEMDLAANVGVGLQVDF